MKKSIIYSLIVLSVLSYADNSERLSSVEIMKNALAQMKTVIEDKSLDVNGSGEEGELDKILALTNVIQEDKNSSSESNETVTVEESNTSSEVNATAKSDESIKTEESNTSNEVNATVKSDESVKTEESNTSSEANATVKLDESVKTEESNTSSEANATVKSDESVKTEESNTSNETDATSDANETVESNSTTVEEGNETSANFTLGKYGTFKFEKANENVYIMHGPVVSPNKVNQGFMNNPAVIESEHGLIVIDPGGNYNVGKKILAEIEKVSPKPIVAVFNTHKHGDHWFANKAIVEKYPDVEIYAHPNMIKVTKEGDAEVWYGILSRTTGNLEGTKEFAFPTKTLEDGQEIEIDGQKFVVQHPKVAHTDTDLLILHLNSKTLFLGDNLMKGRLGSFDESSNILGNIELLENIKKETNFTLYVPGHGLSGKRDETIDPFLNYLKLLSEEGIRAYEEDKEAYEVKDQVKSKLPWMKSWDAFEKNMPAHLNKVMLEISEKELEAEDNEEE